MKHEDSTPDVRSPNCGGNRGFSRDSRLGVEIDKRIVSAWKACHAQSAVYMCKAGIKPRVRLLSGRICGNWRLRGRETAAARMYHDVPLRQGTMWRTVGWWRSKHSVDIDACRTLIAADGSA